MHDGHEFVAEFVIESRENLDRFERDLIALEKNPTARETLDSAFRAIHNIKGTTGFVGVDKLGGVAHSAETLLSRLREGTIAIDPEIATTLLALVDYTRRVLAAIERDGVEADADDPQLVAALNRLAQPNRPAAPDQSFDSQPLPTVAEQPLFAQDKPSRSTSNANIRVDVAQMDVLMNLVGELVLARNEMLQSPVVLQNPILLNTSQRLSAITAQLQDGIMKTRMQPIDTVWSALPRMVRDLARQVGKAVRLELVGNDTELDRSLLEAIKDPLTHLIRNAIDHGLETREGRLAAGKNLEGHLLLRAFHEGGQVNIEVSDDGAGVDVAAVTRKAVERGLIGADAARSLSEQEAINLIFLPGFSTADKVTSLSGRGVGMDVVKTNIERIGGKVTIHSERGKGTTLKIRIPLTLAILPALVVTSRGERYAIPQVNVLELVRLEQDAVRAQIERIHTVAVYRLRGELLPLIALSAELSAAPASERGAWIDALGDAVHIVVLHADGRKFGLIVDEVVDTQEIVVKPLGSQLRGLATFAGATIMGDGRVALILDASGLAAQAQMTSAVREAATIRAESPAAPQHTTQALLLFADADDTRMAVPLSQATRLEEFARDTIERVGTREVVQYRGDIMPLIRLSALRNEADPGTVGPTSCLKGETIRTIVYTRDGRRVGIVVDHILDTIEALVLEPANETSGRNRTTVIQGRVTQMVDLDVLCAGIITVPAQRGAAA